MQNKTIIKASSTSRKTISTKSLDRGGLITLPHLPWYCIEIKERSKGVDQNILFVKSVMTSIDIT